MACTRIHLERVGAVAPFAAHLLLGVVLGLAALAAPTSALAQDAEEAPVADPWTVGEPVEPIDLEDQHGEPLAIDARTRVVLFSRDMDGGALLKDALEGIGQGTLDSLGAVYVSDISGMPKMVARLFAVPSMRRRPYSMALDRTGEATARIPDEEARATLIFLDGLRVKRIEHVDSANAVRKTIGLPERTE